MDIMRKMNTKMNTMMNIKMNSSFFFILPLEIIWQILLSLDYEDVIALFLSCKIFYNMKTNDFWKEYLRVHYNYTQIMLFNISDYHRHVIEKIPYLHDYIYDKYYIDRCYDMYMIDYDTMDVMLSICDSRFYKVRYSKKMFDFLLKEANESLSFYRTLGDKYERLEEFHGRFFEDSEREEKIMKKREEKEYLESIALEPIEIPKSGMKNKFDQKQKFHKLRNKKRLIKMEEHNNENYLLHIKAISRRKLRK